MIRVNVFIQTSEANRAEAIQTGIELTAKTLKEEGCIAYDLFKSSTRKDVLMICETWKDTAALSAHEQTSHFKTLVAKLQELGSLKLEKFEF